MFPIFNRLLILLQHGMNCPLGFQLINKNKKWHKLWTKIVGIIFWVSLWSFTFKSYLFVHRYNIHTTKKEREFNYFICIVVIPESYNTSVCHMESTQRNQRLTQLARVTRSNFVDRGTHRVTCSYSASLWFGWVLPNWHTQVL